MKLIKENLKLIIGMFCGVIIASTTIVLAGNSLADDIYFTATNRNWKANNVTDALNDLYAISNIEFGMPTGTIISYMGNTAPAGYLPCDGSIYNIADYQELANQIKEQFGSYNYFGGDGETTFAVSDLRGEFLRGTGTNSHANQGSGATVGAHQDATSMPLINFYGSNLEYIIQLTGESNWYTNADSITSTSNILRNFKPNWNGAVVEKYNSTFTTRPTNTSVLYCVKY